MVDIIFEQIKKRKTYNLQVGGKEGGDCDHQQIIKKFIYNVPFTIGETIAVNMSTSSNKRKMTCCE